MKAFEGHTCPLARYGYSRDERRHNPQIVVGLLTNGDGCPLAAEVFEGHLGDPQTVAVQLDKLRSRFGLERPVLVGDRGMLTSRRLEDELRGLEGLDWITAPRARQVQKLAADGGGIWPRSPTRIIRRLRHSREFTHLCLRDLTHASD